MSEITQISLTNRCNDAVAHLKRKPEIYQIKLYVRGAEREALRADSSFLNQHSADGINAIYVPGNVGEDFIVFERK